MEKPFCAANCAAVRPLLRQASTRARQRASRSGLRVRMRVTVPRRREVRNDADSRSGYNSCVRLDCRTLGSHDLALALEAVAHRTVSLEGDAFSVPAA